MTKLFPPLKIEVLGQQDGYQVKTAAKPDDHSSVSTAHMAQGENQLPQAVRPMTSLQVLWHKCSPTSFQKISKMSTRKRTSN